MTFDTRGAQRLSTDPDLNATMVFLVGAATMTALLVVVAAFTNVPAAAILIGAAFLCAAAFIAVMIHLPLIPDQFKL